MVRVFIKGGVWKNSEDEILKAAVMKYGKQQWARVASLLNRKSAKQCKARWFEWLDPSIKKVEWSREEEEKLLHLAKLMPAQWRSIGPLVGRTAAQCQDHYELLLDSAAADSTENAEGTSLTSKRLRPGEIDAHPETKPARPDPMDMDEDEIEMLQEARARLANTQGKKAKRKQREKMLQEAKRLADLQKRRELKQAGLLSSQARTKLKKRQREVDYATEIPFHKPAPAGFHDVALERQKADDIRNKRLKSIDYKQVNEQNYRTRDAEEQAMRKREEQRLKNLERANLQLVISQQSEKVDPVSQRKRGVLNMPAPMVDEAELQQVAKLANTSTSTMLPPPNRNGKAPTDVLLGDYSDRPLPTPMRTPNVVSGGGSSTREMLLKEAANLKILSEGQTPLLGGENRELSSGLAAVDAASSDIGMTPRIGTDIMNRKGGDVGATPMTMSTRDELGLNMNHAVHQNAQLQQDDASISTFGATSTTIGSNVKSARAMAREERRAIQKARLELAAALAAIPAPQYEYELAAPDNASAATDHEDASLRVAMEKDAADVEAEELRRLQEEAAALYAKRSSVVKRLELPRPVGVLNVDAITNRNNNVSRAFKMLEEEALKLMQHDAHAHPYVFEDVVNGAESASSSVHKKKKSSKKKKTKKGQSSANNKNDENKVVPPEVPLDHIPSEVLDASRELLVKECSNNVDASGEYDYGGPQVGADTDVDVDSIEYMQRQLAAIKAATYAVQKRADKMAANLSIKNGGYVNRADGLSNDMHSTFQELQHAKIEEYVYNNLMRVEELALPRRIEKIEEDMKALEDGEVILQRTYGELLLEKNRLVALSKKQAVQVE
mmetsp:Transcript_14751/g.22895  ORF Transcript_14751/g.22895 Transcript_14751/m.22895 type:complete len:841 (-) Transcript_14751:35-2557(-)